MSIVNDWLPMIHILDYCLLSISQIFRRSEWPVVSCVAVEWSIIIVSCVAVQCCFSLVNNQSSTTRPKLCTSLSSRQLLTGPKSSSLKWRVLLTFLKKRCVIFTVISYVAFVISIHRLRAGDRSTGKNAWGRRPTDCLLPHQSSPHSTFT